MVLGNIYAEFAAMPNNLAPVSRASIGLVADPGGMIDLVVAADSMYDVVEAAQAACRDDTEAGRRKIYAGLVNEAVNQYNQQQVDSALALAMRGLGVYDGYKLAYIAHNIRGNALQSKDSLDAAIAAFIRMSQLMKGDKKGDSVIVDTSLVDERKNTMIGVARLMMRQSEALEGDAKGAKLRVARTYLDEYMNEFPGDEGGKGAIDQAKISAGGASADSVFVEMAASPEKYSADRFFEVGVVAARTSRPKEAIALFDAGLKKNPWSRDALFNLSITMQQEQRFTEAETHLRRLVTIDPENPEVYQVFALNFRGLAEIAKKAAEKKPATSPEAKAYAAVNDSLLVYYERFSKAPAKVTFNLWNHDGGKNVLAGTVENLTDAEKSYSLKFEFLDEKGTVISSKTADVTGVASKSTKGFRVEAEGENVVGFRYLPFPPAGQ
jgi:tetratricopeptide (TPR) repeat protein